MSLEAAMVELAAALRENTEVHKTFTAVAQQAVKERPAAAAGKTEAPAAETPKAAASTKKTTAKTEAPAEAPKAAAKKPAPKKPPTIAGTASAQEVKDALRPFLEAGGEDDADGRDQAKAHASAAFKHLGVKRISELETDTDRAKLVGYIAYWNAGLPVNFEEIDEIVMAQAPEGEDAPEDDDDMGLDDD